jgi:hypothetical protein
MGILPAVALALRPAVGRTSRLTRCLLLDPAALRSVTLIRLVAIFLKPSRTDAAEIVRPYRPMAVRPGRDSDRPGNNPEEWIHP